MKETVAIEEVRSSKELGPYCVATVQPGCLWTTAGKAARAKRERRGVPVEQCAMPATHRIDGALLCRRHAGETALKLLTDGLPIERRRAVDVIDVRGSAKPR